MSSPSPTMQANLAAPPGAPLPELPARSFGRQVLVDTFAMAGARVGAAWIAVLVFCAVFAPFIASSHPFLARIDGEWSSPLLRYLAAPDVVLLISTFAVVLLLALPARWRPPHRFWLWIGATLLSIPLCLWLVRPPQTVVYEQWRDLERAGKIERAYYAPIRFSANDRLRDMPELRLKPPTRKHWFGTEANGADILSRMIHASRIAMAIGLIATGIAVVIGVFVGGLMGYFVGKVDLFGMRLIEIFEAIPTLFLLLTIVAFFGRNLYLLMTIIGLTSWTGDARFIRAEFLKLREQDFVHAARAAGLPLGSILFRHMLPNGIAPVLVAASFGVASAILYESILSFLGLGLVDEPSWGQMLNQALGVGGTFIWWIAVFPGMAIFFTVFAYNLVGEALRDAIDPKLRKQI